MKKLKNMLLLVMGLVILIGAYWIFSGMGNPSKEQITSTGVLERIQPLREMNTVEMYFNEIIDFNDAKHFHNYQIPFTQKSFIFTVKARVKAGIDLMALTQEDIQINGTQITLTLPAPTITSKEILEYKAYDEKDGLFNEITTEDTFKALNQFEGSLEKQALDSGILEQAQKNAKESLAGLLKSLEFETIVIKFNQ